MIWDSDLPDEADIETHRQWIIGGRRGTIVVEIPNVQFTRRGPNNTFRVGRLNGGILGIVWGAINVSIADEYATFYNT
jgi:hypothetical protein